MIKEEILNYFNIKVLPNTHRHRNICLKVLDNKYRKYYTGVSLQYIVYDLLKGKYKKSEVCKILHELVVTNQIQPLYCPDVKKIVFERPNNIHSSYFRTTKEKVLKYLETFIK